MADRESLQSEGEQLDAILAELQRENQIKDISGWRTGFANVDSALDGVLPGLHFLVGPSGCGKTSFAKQLLDQIALHNSVPGIFFTFTESQKELRIKTLARLSDIETRAIRRGSAYMLHWYGVPRLGGEQASQLSASWEKLRRSAEEAKSWLDRVYLVECDRSTDVSAIEASIRQVQKSQQNEPAFVVIDDCQRLLPASQPLSARINQIAEELAVLAEELRLPIFAVASTDLSTGDVAPKTWLEKVPSAAVIMVMQSDPFVEKLTAPTQSITLQIVKNRSGERGALAFEFAPAFAKFTEK